MKISVFKRLIKEAVVEALYEEAPAIINEVLKHQSRNQLMENRNINFSSNDVVSLNKDVRKQLTEKMGNMMGYNVSSNSNVELQPVTEENSNPFLSFIMDAAQNMTPQDKAGLKNLDM